MKFLLGKKREMSQIFHEDGTVVPVTYIEAGPCVITDIRTQEKDGYMAVQVGFGKTRHVAKPQASRAVAYGPVAFTREHRLDSIDGVQLGDALTVETFTTGDTVDVSGDSKGRGFAGVVKRHGFHGQDTTHGTKDQVRKSGSIGASGVQRVFKGMRMAGRMGGNQVTVKNLKIEAIDVERNLLAVRGAVPGAYGTLVTIIGKEKTSHWA